MRRLACLFSLLWLCGCASTSGQSSIQHQAPTGSALAGSSLFLDIRDEPGIRFAGEVNRHTADEAGGMFYPGNTAAVFLASVLTHAMIQGASNTHAENEAQSAANAILAEYQAVIPQVTATDLTTTAVTELSGRSLNKIQRLTPETSQAEWVIQSLPVFVLTQDQSTLMLKNAIRVYRADKPSQPQYQNLVEVISVPYQGDPAAYWLNGGPAQLLVVSRRLFTESIRIAMSDMSDQLQPVSAEKTFGYVAGGETRFERGRLAEQTCGRITIRGLRGWLKSVPLTESGGAFVCS